MSVAPSGRPAISGTTALVGVLGDPVRHSLSPAMHNAALEELGLDWVYLALPAPAPELAGVVRALEALDCRGLNVTLPHKQAVASLCTELSPLARRLGAVNTLVRRAEGGWWGTNTDGEGFLAPLREQGLAGASRRAVVLGCGGSARAVVAGLIDLGLAGVQVAGRRPEALRAFVAEVAGDATAPEALPWSDGPGLSDALAAADLVVNTTPVGMASGHDPAAAEGCPLRSQELAALTPGTCVYDLIYTPRPSRLLREAAERGCATLDGLEMLVQQGAASLRLWTGLAEVPVQRMRAAALARLQSP
jgi:shikimate dehydrogenase